jgi:hypothetical protein
MIGGKENGDAGDVVRLSDATERRARDHRLLEIATNDAAAVSALGLDLACAIAFTRIFRGPDSAASPRVIASTAPRR